MGGDNTQDIILLKARELFLSLGYHKTTMRQIAKEAGISTGPLYFHFRNKAEIFCCICSQAYDHLLVLFRKALDSEDCAGVRLRLSLNRTGISFLLNRSCLKYCI